MNGRTDLPGLTSDELSALLGSTIVADDPTAAIRPTASRCVKWFERSLVQALELEKNGAA